MKNNVSSGIFFEVIGSKQYYFLVTFKNVYKRDKKAVSFEDMRGFIHNYNGRITVERREGIK